MSEIVEAFRRGEHARERAHIEARRPYRTLLSEALATGDFLSAVRRYAALVADRQGVTAGAAVLDLVEDLEAIGWSAPFVPEPSVGLGIEPTPGGDAFRAWFSDEPYVFGVGANAWEAVDQLQEIRRAGGHRA